MRVAIGHVPAFIAAIEIESVGMFAASFPGDTRARTEGTETEAAMAILVGMDSPEVSGGIGSAHEGIIKELSGVVKALFGGEFLQAGV